MVGSGVCSAGSGDVEGLIWVRSDSTDEILIMHSLGLELTLSLVNYAWNLISNNV